jgi:hypothetical protein
MARHAKKSPQFYKSPADLVAHFVRTAAPAPDLELPTGADPTRSRYRYCPVCNDGRRHVSTPAEDYLATHIRHHHDLDYHPSNPHRQHAAAARLQDAIALDTRAHPPQPYPSNWKYDSTRVPDWSAPDVQAYLSQWDGEYVIENTIDGEPVQGTARALKILLETRERHRQWIRWWLVDRRDGLRAAGFKMQIVKANRSEILYLDRTVSDLAQALVTDHRAFDGFLQCADEWLAGVRHG